MVTGKLRQHDFLTRIGCFRTAVDAMCAQHPYNNKAIAIEELQAILLSNARG